MIINKYKFMLTICMVFLLVNVTIVSCTSDLLKTSKTSSVDEKGNEEVFGKVTCIDENFITLAIGNECDSEIIEDDRVDALEETDNNNLQSSDTLFEPSGEEKAIEISDESLINIEKGNVRVKGKLSDIIVGSILSVQYDEANNIIFVLIKDSSKYSN